MPTRKTDGSPNAQARALLQLCDTPITADLPSPAEILHGHPAQGAVLSRPSKRVNICQIRQRLIELQEKQKKKHFDRAHRAKDLCILKVKEQGQFFPNKQGTGPIKWMTGTMTEILECGWSYMIQAPIWSSYVMTAPPFKTIQWKKERNSPKTIPFKTISPARPNPCPSRGKPATWTPGPCCLMNQTHIKYPQHYPHHHPQGATHWDHHHAHPPASFPSRESSMEPSSADSSPEGRKRHQSKPAFIWPHDVDQGLSHGLSALLAETSPLAPYRLQWQAKAKVQEKISTHKWLLSRPFGTDTVNWLISRPLCIQTELAAFKTIWDIHGG